MNAVLSEKGQITIPKLLRDELGLGPGAVLEFKTEKGKLVAWKKIEDDVVERWRGKGKLPVGRNVDEYLKIIRRGDRD